LKSTASISFSSNPSIKKDLICKTKDEYFVATSQCITDIILESALLYQHGLTTPIDITAKKKLSMKPNLAFQTHFNIFSNIVLKNCILVERVDTVFWSTKTEYIIGELGPDKGRVYFIVPERKAISSFVSYTRVRYSLVDQKGREYLRVQFKYDSGKNYNFQISSELKDAFKSDVGEEFVELMEV
jgi:hypothetical protein